MFLKKLSILLAVVLVSFTCNISTASALVTIAPSYEPSAILKELDMLSNDMYLLIKSTSKEKINTDDLMKQTKFLDTLIKNLKLKSTEIPKANEDISLAVHAILDLYQISILKAESYIKKRDSNDLITAIFSFSSGYSSLSDLKNAINGARN